MPPSAFTSPAVTAASRCCSASVRRTRFAASLRPGGRPSGFLSDSLPSSGAVAAADLASFSLFCFFFRAPSAARFPPAKNEQNQASFASLIQQKSYSLRCERKERAPGGQHRTAPNAHQTASWPMQLGWGVSGDNLSATFMPRLCVYGRLLAPPDRGGATGIGH